MRIILASSSKQRQDILKMIGIPYEVIKSLAKEESNEKNPELYVQELSKIKANSVAEQVLKDALIISADSVIYKDCKIYEKPKSKKEAIQMMNELTGTESYATTGITVKDLYNNREITSADTCKVYLRNASHEEIEWYVNHEEGLLNIAGYAMLGKGSVFLEKVDGDFNTLIGISPNKLLNMLKELGYEITDIVK